MSVFKCKMCGGSLEIQANQTTAVCEYCGTQQTLPKLDDERRANLYDRANHFRRNNEFDKAAGIYEQILNEDGSDAEAYWSLVLCRYGIEYVEDPATHKRIPTVNRAQFTSIFDDDNYKSALRYADGYQKSIYEAEANAINEIQKGILAISQKEEPFDVFICYKETDRDGRRTQDSVLANDLYYQLTQQGFKVFFSRITLEDKLGTAYEPYIFAALNSAKVMVVLGTKPEYFNAVWVKNEWSRYLALVKQSGGKKVLIPAYRDMDPYDLPEEFSHLQAQDMSKLGFMQDLIRGIKKLVQADEPKAAAKETVVVNGGNANIAPLLKRAFMYLEDGDWANADDYCERVLDIDPENAQAYLGKLMAELQVRRQADLPNCQQPFDDRANFQKVVRFGEDGLKATLAGYIAHINERNENERLMGVYNHAVNAMNTAGNEAAFRTAAKAFQTIPGWKDADKLAEQCLEQAEICRKNAAYASAKSHMTGDVAKEYEEALRIFQTIPGWKDADEQICACRRRIEELRAKEAAHRLELERQAELARKEAERIKKRNRKIAVIAAAVVCPAVAFVVLLNAVIIPSSHYHRGIELREAGDYDQAITAFLQAGNYQDAKEQYRDVLQTVRKSLPTAAVAAGSSHTVGVKANGTVAAVGYNGDGECNVSDWEDIVAVAAGFNHTVGLKADGTVAAVGDNRNGQCNVSDWEDIVAVAAGFNYTVGLKADGTVVAVGDNRNGQCDVSAWRDIVAVAAGFNYTVGLKGDGTVVAIGDNEDGQCDVSDWEDIVAVAAGGSHTVGVKADGTVVAIGDNENGQCDVSDWVDIVAVAAGTSHTVGLKGDGTVVAVGNNAGRRCNVSDWEGIVAVAAGFNHTVGLKGDGTVVAVGDNRNGQCDVSDWRDIKVS